jgi:hypothetical protein
MLYFCENFTHTKTHLQSKHGGVQSGAYEGEYVV